MPSKWWVHNERTTYLGMISPKSARPPLQYVVAPQSEQHLQMFYVVGCVELYSLCNQRHQMSHFPTIIPTVFSNSSPLLLIMCGLWCSCSYCNMHFIVSTVQYYCSKQYYCSNAQNADFLISLHPKRVSAANAQPKWDSIKLHGNNFS